ncbi:MAG: hypothetical protein V1495_04460 [Pseudomonadota bacterium]
MFRKPLAVTLTLWLGLAFTLGACAKQTPTTTVPPANNTDINKAKELACAQTGDTWDAILQICKNKASTLPPIPTQNPASCAATNTCGTPTPPPGQDLHWTIYNPWTWVAGAVGAYGLWFLVRGAFLHGGWSADPFRFDSDQSTTAGSGIQSTQNFVTFSDYEAGSGVFLTKPIDGMTNQGKFYMAAHVRSKDAIVIGTQTMGKESSVCLNGKFTTGSVTSGVNKVPFQYQIAQPNLGQERIFTNITDVTALCKGFEGAWITWQESTGKYYMLAVNPIALGFKPTTETNWADPYVADGMFAFSDLTAASASFALENVTDPTQRTASFTISNGTEVPNLATVVSDYVSVSNALMGLFLSVNMASVGGNTDPPTRYLNALKVKKVFKMAGATVPELTTGPAAAVATDWSN